MLATAAAEARGTATERCSKQTESSSHPQQEAARCNQHRASLRQTDGETHKQKDRQTDNETGFMKLWWGKIYSSIRGIDILFFITVWSWG